MNYVETSLDLFFNSQTGPAPVKKQTKTSHYKGLWQGGFWQSFGLDCLIKEIRGRGISGFCQLMNKYELSEGTKVSTII